MQIIKDIPTSSGFAFIEDVSCQLEGKINPTEKEKKKSAIAQLLNINRI